MALGGLSTAPGAGPVRAVLFDAMGTLLALQEPVPRLVRALRDDHGLSVSPEQARRALAAEIAFYRAHHDEGRDAVSLADLRLRCAGALRAALPQSARLPPAGALVTSLLGALRFEIFADVAPALAQLRGAGLRLAVVSNWDVSLHEVLRDAGLADGFDAVLTSAEVGAAKPSPAIFAAALSALGVRAADALHVGDSPEHDVAGARASGLRAVLLRRDGAVAGGAGAPVIASLSSLAGLVTGARS